MASSKPIHIPHFDTFTAPGGQPCSRKRCLGIHTAPSRHTRVYFLFFRPPRYDKPMATRLRSLFNAAHAPHLHPVQCTSHDAYKKPLGRVNRCHRHTSTLMGHTQLQSDGGIDNIASNLPASPLADGSFLLARTRWKRPKPEKKTLATSTKFQRQLARNPFGMISICLPIQHGQKLLICLSSTGPR